MATYDCPIEYDEEVAFSDYLEERGFVHWHVPQETFTKSWGTKMKNKKQGVRKGVSDHWVIVPTKMGFKVLVALEMKRQRGGTVSDEQIEFLRALNAAQGVLGVVALGAEQAIRVVEAVERNKAGDIKDIIDFTNALIPSYEKIKKTPKTCKKCKKCEKNSCPF